MQTPSSRTVAAFVNVDSLAGRHGADLHAADIVRELSRFGSLQAAFAYGDWVHQRRLQQEFDTAAFRLIAVPRIHVSGDGPQDERHAALVEQAFRISLDALEFALSHPRIDTIAIAGASPLYAQVSARLRAHGLKVIGIGPEDADCAGWVSSCHRYVYTSTMLGKRAPAATFEEGQRRITRLVAARGVDAVARESAASIHTALIEADPAFDPRNYGCADFETWMSKYQHLVTPHAAGTHVEVERRQSGSGAASGPRHVAPDNVTRAILMRSLVEASWSGFPMPLARFRDVVQTVAPDFDELSFGFDSFTACLGAFPDLVIVDRDTWHIFPNDGVIPLDPPRPRTPTHDRGGPRTDRRRQRSDGDADHDAAPQGTDAL